MTMTSMLYAQYSSQIFPCRLGPLSAFQSYAVSYILCIMMTMMLYYFWQSATCSSLQCEVSSHPYCFVYGVHSARVSMDTCRLACIKM